MEKNHPEESKREHFSIRGYAAEMRKKDASICFPFAFNGNHKNLVNQASVLPPLCDTKPRWGGVEEDKKDEAEHGTIIDRLGSQSSGLGTLICAEDGSKRIESMICDASKIASTINEEKKEHDNLLSESDEFLAKNSHHNQRYTNNLSGFIPQKTRKVRSLNELLEDHSTQTETGPSSVMPGIKGKRKIPYDKKDWKPLRFISPSNKLTKKTQVFKADASVVVTDSKSQQDASARVDSRAGVKNQCTQHIIDGNAMLSKMKNKQTQFEGGFSPLIIRQDVVPKTNQVETGDGKKHCVATVDGGFSKSVPDVFSKKLFLFDLNQKMDADNEMENIVPRVENRSSSPHHPQQDFFGTRNSENTIQVEEQGNDDIPMEIVEFMARNQYERYRHVGEKNSFFSKQTDGKRDVKLMGFPIVQGNGVPKPLQQKNCRMTKMPILEVHNSYQNGSRESEVAEHVGLQNRMPYGLFIPQKYAAHSGNFEMNSQFPKTVSEGRMIGDLDLNFMNPNANNLEKQNKNFDFESFRKAFVELPLVHKHRDFDLNVKPSASVDFRSSNNIPAMELLNLMDARMQPSSTISLDGKPKFFTKHFSPYDHHPKIGLDETSKILRKPLLPYVHHSKEFSNRGSGVFNDSTRYLSSGFYGKNLPLNKPHECSPDVPVPIVSSFSSLLQNNGNFKRGTLKFEERGKVLMESTSGISCINHEFNSIQDMQKGFNGTSDTMVFPLQCHTIENTGKCIDMEAGCMNATIFPMRIISENEICSINRNPADFTTPEEGNEYMISDQDLQFKNTISSNGKSQLINVDGRKRQRVPKLSSNRKGIHDIVEHTHVPKP